MSIQERAQEAIKVLKAVNGLGLKGFQRASRHRLDPDFKTHPDWTENPSQPLFPIDQAIREAEDRLS